MRRYSAVAYLIVRHHAREDISYPRQTLRSSFYNMTRVFKKIEIIVGGIAYHTVKYKYKTEHKSRNGDHRCGLYYCLTIRG